MIGTIEKQPSKKLPDRTINPVIPSLIVIVQQYSGQHNVYANKNGQTLLPPHSFPCPHPNKSTYNNIGQHNMKHDERCFRIEIKTKTKK